MFVNKWIITLNIWKHSLERKKVEKVRRKKNKRSPQLFVMYLIY